METRYTVLIKDYTSYNEKTHKYEKIIEFNYNDLIEAIDLIEYVTSHSDYGIELIKQKILT